MRNLKSFLAYILAFMLLILSACAANSRGQTSDRSENADSSTESILSEESSSAVSDVKTVISSNESSSTSPASSEKPPASPVSTVHVHDWVKATCTAPKTCKSCGAVSGNPLGHNYSGGKCTRCGDTNGPLDPKYAKFFKNKLTDAQNAEALNVAQEIVKQIENKYPEGQDLERIGMAAELVSAEYRKGVHVEKGNYYNQAYGVFVKRESSCAGCCRALGLVLSIMGYKWTHVNENQWTHQWLTVDVNDKTIWADGQVGLTGEGEHPLA